MTWQFWSDQVRQTAAALSQAGVKAGDRIGLLSENRPEWTMVDLGALSLGAAVVPVYITSSPAEVEYILTDAGIEILFLSNLEHFIRLESVLKKNPVIKKVIIFDTKDAKLSFDSFLETGKNVSRDEFERWVNAVKPADLATIIYTSGTTGPPKGVMLTHSNFIQNYLAAKKRIRVDKMDLSLSFLPLSHVFERLAGYYFMVFCGAPIAYAENMQTVAEDIRLVRPTVAAAVPRFYEKTYAKVLENVQAASPLQQQIFYWALRQGRKKTLAHQRSKKLSFFEHFLYCAARFIVFKKIKKRLGGRIRFFISGGAPLAKELAEFFYAADVLILEGYGLTETSPVIAVNGPEEFKFGTVGKPLEGIDVKIAEDGEILTKGPCVMAGYYKKPDATRDVMEGGWFHTGDIGKIDSDGFLKITDRKKDIIVTSGGKNVAPQNIEGLLCMDKIFSQVVVIGDKRNYLVALVVPNRQEVEAFAKKQGLNYMSWEALLKTREIYKLFEERMRERTKELAPYEQIKYFDFLPEELSQEKGEITPTLKVKRKVIMEKHRQRIEDLYRRGEAAKEK